MGIGVVANVTNVEYGTVGCDFNEIVRSYTGGKSLHCTYLAMEVIRNDDCL